MCLMLGLDCYLPNVLYSDKDLPMSDSTFITRVELLNYKSITHCDVKLGPLMFLVGPNGSGKSNFLDALRFVSDALNTTLDHAIRQRGGIRELKRRGSVTTQPLDIRIHFRLESGEYGYYHLRLKKDIYDKYSLLTEECRIYAANSISEKASYYVDEGEVRTSERIAPVASPNRLYLVAASGLPVFRPVYEALSRMVFYNLIPERIREAQIAGMGDRLSRDGGNIVEVLKNMSAHSSDAKTRIEQYMASVVPGIVEVNAKDFGPYETLEFTQQMLFSSDTWNFYASSMSDGTLRALGILVALFQEGYDSSGSVVLVGIEEPETALHPAAVGALLDAMDETSMSKQILVTSHSAELLDDKQVTADMLLAVRAEKWGTRIGPLDEAGRYALRESLFTAGELLRMNQLAPEPASAAELADELLVSDESPV